jgi:hypothetical protein
MKAAEIRRVKIPPEANLNMFDLARLMLEALIEIAAQIADHNEREQEHEDELRRIMEGARAGQA